MSFWNKLGTALSIGSMAIPGVGPAIGLGTKAIMGASAGAGILGRILSKKSQPQLQDMYLGTGGYGNPYESFMGSKGGGVGGGTNTGGGKWYDFLKNPQYSIPLGLGIAGGIAGMPKNKAELDLIRSQTRGSNLQNQMGDIQLRRLLGLQPSVDIAQKQLPEMLQGRGLISNYLDTLGKKPMTYSPALQRLLQQG